MLGLGFGLTELSVAGTGSGGVSFTILDETGAAVTDWPGLRVSIDGGAWQTLSAASLTVSESGGVVTIAGFSGSETSIDIHNLQEQPGEPFSAASSIDHIYANLTGADAPALTDLPGMPIVATTDGSPIEVTL